MKDPLIARRRIIILASLFLLSACTLPGAISPTPFAFPTANLTLTQVLAPTSTITPIPPPETILESPTPSAEVSLPPSTPESVTSTPTVEFQTRPNGPIIRAGQVLEPPIINGELSEWTQTFYPCDQNTYGAASWTGELDAAGSFMVAWDSENLYIGIEVTDDVFAQVSSGKYLFRGDSIEIQLDTNLLGDFTSSVLSSDDFQIGITPGNFGTLSPGVYRWFPSSLAGPLLNASSASSKIAAGYVLEASVPWSTLGITPSASDTFGFVLSISDNDAAGTASQHSLISSASSRTLTDPTSWGTLHLIGTAE